MTYVGPGDVISFAKSWYGLRAYSAATLGTKCLQVRRNDSGATKDINTLTSTGLIDLQTMVNFLGPELGTVSAVYDQTGNGFDLTQGTVGNQPTIARGLLWAVGGNNYPAIGFHSSFSMATAAVPVTTFPISVSLVHFTSGQDAGTPNNLILSLGANTGFVIQNGFGQYFLASTNVSAANPASTQAPLANRANDAAFVANGTGTAIDTIAHNGIILSSSLNAGNTAPGGTTLVVSSSGAVGFGAYIFEVGFWNAAFTPAQISNLHNNQQAFWQY